MLIIIADDITGAAEVAGVCLRFGLRVSFGIDELPEGVADVKVIATDSRQSNTLEAVRIHRKLAEDIKSKGITEIFKKTDSTLRGYVIDEIDELMEVYGYERVVLQPSNPWSGRCIKTGKYKIAGVPLNFTSFKDDPDFPAHYSSVKDLLLSRNLDQNANILTENINVEEKGFFIPDCSSEADMKRTLSLPVENCLYAGSAAFLSAYLKVKHGLHMMRRNLSFNPFEGRFLLICGSTHQESREFINMASNKGVQVSEMPESLMIKGVDDNELVKWSEEQAVKWNEYGQMIISFSSEIYNYDNCTNILKKRMSRVVNILMEKCPVVELLIEGGATAYSILKELGWTNLNPVKEFSLGVVRMQVMSVPGFYLIVKPGSYQWPDNFVI
jgi:uncharacterized protein YgbK (DUF1537 family)